MEAKNAKLEEENFWLLMRSRRSKIWDWFYRVGLGRVGSGKIRIILVGAFEKMKLGLGLRGGRGLGLDFIAA